MKPNLLNRALMAAALVALAVNLGVWLTREPLTAAPAPAAAPAKTAPAKPSFPQPTLAPLPPGPAAPPASTTATVEVSYEIAPLPPPRVKVLAFTANWCGSCRRAKPTLTQMQASGTEVEIIDIDRRPDLARQHGITRVPTFLVFADKQLLVRTHDAATVAATIKAHGSLGITLQAEVAQVKSVLPRSAAERAGLRVGDIICAVNGCPTPKTGDLIATVRRHLPGSTVQLTVKRGAAKLDLDATLGTAE